MGATDNERALLQAARECCGSDGLSSSALLKASTLPDSSYYRALKALVSGGLVVNVGTDRQPRYRPAVVGGD